MYEIFAGNKKLFEGLAITNESDFLWEQHPIIHFDFSRIQSLSSDELRKYIEWKVVSTGEQYGVDVSTGSTLGIKFEMLVTQLSEKNKVVVLVDEYDHPILSSLKSDSSNTLADEKRIILKGLQSFFGAALFKESRAHRLGDSS